MIRYTTEISARSLGFSLGVSSNKHAILTCYLVIWRLQLLTNPCTTTSFKIFYHSIMRFICVVYEIWIFFQKEYSWKHCIDSFHYSTYRFQSSVLIHHLLQSLRKPHSKNSRVQCQEELAQVGDSKVISLRPAADVGAPVGTGENTTEYFNHHSQTVAFVSTCEGLSLLELSSKRINLLCSQKFCLSLSQVQEIIKAYNSLIYRYYLLIFLMIQANIYSELENLFIIIEYSYHAPLSNPFLHSKETLW